MTLHEKGLKSERDRAILINSYDVMCGEFHVPGDKRLTRGEIASMSNKALYRASKDLYSQATVKQVNKLAVKMGLKDKPISWIGRIAMLFKKKQRKKDYEIVKFDQKARSVTFKHGGENVKTK